MKFQKPKGTNDIFGDDVFKWQQLESLIRQNCKIFGFNEIRTPIFEYLSLFKRGVGENSDIVKKEMFAFNDRGDRQYVLKPEGTAGTVRAFIENKLYANSQPSKLFYITPCFRDERNQAGRFKQFHQFGIEVFGSYEPSLEVEVISFVYHLLNILNIQNVTLKLNSLGDSVCREKYNSVLKQFLISKLEYLCDDCKSRFDKNPLRILDCKNPTCKQYLIDCPKSINYLDVECKNHFETVKSYLSSLNIPFEIDHNIVRGIDYYNKTVFEFVCKSEILGSQTTICGGGRYDNLVFECGGNKTGALGFGMGLERILLLMQEQNSDFKNDFRPTIYIGSTGQDGFLFAQKLAYRLRQNNIYAEYDIVGRSVKAQLKYADKINAKYVVIIGDEELKTRKANLKIMDESIERLIDLDNIDSSLD